jgi:hypothetical protein
MSAVLEMGCLGWMDGLRDPGEPARRERTRVRLTAQETSSIASILTNTYLCTYVISVLFAPFCSVQ